MIEVSIPIKQNFNSIQARLFISLRYEINSRKYSSAWLALYPQIPIERIQRKSEQLISLSCLRTPKSFIASQDMMGPNRLISTNKRFVCTYQSGGSVCPLTNKETKKSKAVTFQIWFLLLRFLRPFALRRKDKRLRVLLPPHPGPIGKIDTISTNYHSLQPNADDRQRPKSILD